MQPLIIEANVGIIHTFCRTQVCHVALDAALEHGRQPWKRSDAPALDRPLAAVGKTQSRSNTKENKPLPRVVVVVVVVAVDG